LSTIDVACASYRDSRAADGVCAWLCSPWRRTYEPRFRVSSEAGVSSAPAETPACQWSSGGSARVAWRPLLVFGRSEGDGPPCAVPCLGAGFRLRETIRRRGAGRSGGRRSCSAARALRTAVVAGVSKDRANQALGSALLTPRVGRLVVAVRRAQGRRQPGNRRHPQGFARCPAAGGAES
jgi:hypothetical protein